MKIKTLFIGNELLNGQISNTNLQSLGQILSDGGFQIHQSLTAPDCFEQLVETINELLLNADVLIICGGLGPTEDDITRQAVAAALGLKTVASSIVEAGLRAYMQKHGKTPDEDYYRKQSEVIEGAEVLPNKVGLAPGLLCKSGEKYIYLFPGPPREFTPMLTEVLVPQLQNYFQANSITELFHTFSLSETRVESMLQPLLGKYPFITPAYCADLGHVKLTLLFDVEHSELRGQIVDETLNIFNDDILRTDCLVEPIAQVLLDKQWTLATAESCTGGGVGCEITALAGSSEFFCGSINTYANQWKQDKLAVSAQVLEDFGAVSEECAQEMLDGLCKEHGVDCGIITTGIAGPGGGSEDKPVGLVYIGTKTPEASLVRKYNFRGSRKEVREQSVRYALNQLRLLLVENGNKL